MSANYEVRVVIFRARKWTMCAVIYLLAVAWIIALTQLCLSGVHLIGRFAHWIYS